MGSEMCIRDSPHRGKRVELEWYEGVQETVTTDQLREILQASKVLGAPGISELGIKMILEGPDILLEKMTHIVNSVLQNGEVPFPC